ncbi:hypothetical protein NQ315_011563 [Exocentrus adspersus]|uniref:Peptidase S1 domain-containing protein n=1 Tax=Exocentrus adspersus TaxID=1586481 RepID=A0AAV8VUN6_9CUCU|nr:hypothetical protein NQ315_011563 [Exocentrus adspersus]
MVILSLSSALPAPWLSWDKIKRGNAYVDPVSNYTITHPVDRRIIGGGEVEPHSIPYQVALLIDGRSLCGGSLISLNYVLTAAHCTINASYVELVFGAHNILINESTQLRVTSSNIINHPDFNSSNYNNDIALIQTPTPIVPNEHIQIVKLAPAYAGLYIGFAAVLSGWGTTSDSDPSIAPGLREVHFVVISNTPCAAVYGFDIIDIVDMPKVCSGYGKVGGCSGDSGGPLVVGYYGEQVGIASFVSSRGCESTDPTVYTRVSYYRSWINENSDL